LELLLSCNKDNKNISPSQTNTLDLKNPVEINNQPELHNEYIDKINEKINQSFTLKYIKKIDLGYSENIFFLVGLEFIENNNYYPVYLFLFNKSFEMKSLYITLGTEEYDRKVVMSGISGIFEDTVVAVDDYNNDGVNEIASFVFGGVDNEFIISGFDPETKEYVDYCEVPFFIHAPVEFSPVEFIQYKGISGFKILAPFNRVFEDGKMPQYPVEGDYRGVGWVFYCWDHTSRKFVIFEEVNPQFIGK
jgi:hypothetical protein